jgi:hypothetical protein
MKIRTMNNVQEQDDYKVFKREGYDCRCAICDYLSNKLLTVNTLHERKLCGGSRTSQQSFVSLCRASSMRVYDIVIWVCEFYCTM